LQHLLVATVTNPPRELYFPGEARKLTKSYTQKQIER